MTRRIEELEAAWASQRPAGIPIGRPRGAKLAGVRYERSLAKALAGPKVHGQWWEFRDSAGPGVCQTDLVLPHDGVAVVLEVKYSWTIEGHCQLEWLYLPIVALALKRRSIGIVVTRRLVAGMPAGIRVVGSLGEALAAAEAGKRVVWHWIGGAIESLGPRSGGFGFRSDVAA